MGGEGWGAEDIALGEKSVITGRGGSIVVRRKVFEEVGGFDTRLKNGEDWEFCLRVARKYKIGFVRELLIDYRNHGVNASKNIAEMEGSTLMLGQKRLKRTILRCSGYGGGRMEIFTRCWMDRTFTTINIRVLHETLLRASGSDLPI